MLIRVIVFLVINFAGLGLGGSIYRKRRGLLLVPGLE